MMYQFWDTLLAKKGYKLLFFRNLRKKIGTDWTTSTTPIPTSSCFSSVGLSQKIGLVGIIILGGDLKNLSKFQWWWRVELLEEPLTYGHLD